MRHLPKSIPSAPASVPVLNTPTASITIIVIAMGAWGKGPTYEAALAKCAEVGGRQNAANMHIVYACTDSGCTVTGMGDIEYRHGAALTKIMAIRFGRVMKPT